MACLNKLYFCLLNIILICFVNLSLGAKAKVIELDEDNWHDMLEGEWMVEFFAPWCPACKALQPVWKDFATWSDDLGISVGQVDVTASPGLSGRFMVTALPTIFHVKDGVFRQYRGSRDKEEFMSFIEEKKWKSLEEVPAWKSPGSLQMSVVSQFFKLSMMLRGVHTSLVEDYNIPHWGSYLVFALATILIGAVLGLILVCIVDFVYPVKPAPVPPSFIKETASGRNSDEEDLIEDRNEEEMEAHSEEENAEKSDKEEEEKEEREEEEEEEEEGGTGGEKSENSEPEAQSGSGSDTASSNVRKRRARKTD